MDGFEITPEFFRYFISAYNLHLESNIMQDQVDEQKTNSIHINIQSTVIKDDGLDCFAARIRLPTFKIFAFVNKSNEKTKTNNALVSVSILYDLHKCLKMCDKYIFKKKKKKSYS